MFGSWFGRGSASASRAPPPVAGVPIVPEKDRFTLVHLKILHAALLRESASAPSDASDAALVETLKQLSELMVHGDKHSDRFFEFFGEKGAMALLVSIYTLRSFVVRVQVIQTVSILLINIRNQRSLFYLLSNNHINELLSRGVEVDAPDSEELLAYFVSFMKTLSLSVNSDTVHFFFTAAGAASPASFPLYSQALRLFHHPDHMVRTSVRTITLNVFNVRDPYARAFLLEGEGGSYPSRIASQLRALLLHMHAVTHALMRMTVDSTPAPARGSSSRGVGVHPVTSVDFLTSPGVGSRVATIDHARAAFAAAARMNISTHAPRVVQVESTARNLRADLEDLMREVGDTLFYVQDILTICAREEAEDAAAGADAPPQFKLSKRGVPGLEGVDARAGLTHVADALLTHLRTQVYEPLVLHTLEALALCCCGGAGGEPHADSDAADVHTRLIIDPALAVHMLANSMRVLTYAPMRTWLFERVFAAIPSPAAHPLSDWMAHFSVHIPAAPPVRTPLVAPPSAPASPVHVGAGKDDTPPLPRVALSSSCIMDALIVSVLCDDSRLACLATLALSLTTKYAGTDARLCAHAAQRGLIPRAADDVYFAGMNGTGEHDVATPPRSGSPPILRLDSPPRARAATALSPIIASVHAAATLSPPRRASVGAHVGGMRASVSVNGIAPTEPRAQPLRRSSTTGADTLADGTPLCDGGIRSWRASISESAPSLPAASTSSFVGVHTVSRAHMSAARARVCTVLLASFMRVPCLSTLSASLHAHLLCELQVPPVSAAVDASVSAAPAAASPWLHPYHMRLLERVIAWLGAHVHATLQSARAADVPNSLAPVVNLIEAYADTELRTSLLVPAVMAALLPGYARAAGEPTATPTPSPPLASPAAPAYDLRSPPSSHTLSMNIRSRARACVDGVMASRVDLSHTCEGVHTLQSTHSLARMCSLTLAAVTAPGDWEAWVRACGHRTAGAACALPRELQPFILLDAGAVLHQCVQVLVWMRVLHVCACKGAPAFADLLRAADVLPLSTRPDVAGDTGAWVLPRPSEADLWDGYSVSPDLLLRRIAPPLDSIRVGNVFPVTRLPWFMATHVPVPLDIATPCIGRSASAAVSDDPLKPLSSSLGGATRLGIVLGQSYLVLAEPVASRGAIQRVRALCVAPLQYTYPHTPSKTPHILDMRVLSRDPVPLTRALPLAPTSIRVAADMSVREECEHAGEAGGVEDTLAWPVPLQLGVRGFTLLMDSADLSSHTCMHVDAARRRIMEARLTAIDVLCCVTREDAPTAAVAPQVTPSDAPVATPGASRSTSVADTMATATASALSEAAKMTGGDATVFAASFTTPPPAASRKSDADGSRGAADSSSGRAGAAAEQLAEA